MITMSFGQRLKQSRKNAKLTQEQVSKKLGLDYSTISKYENNHSEPDNETLQKMAEMYGVTVGFLITGSTDNLPADKNEHQSSKSAKELLQEMVDDPDDFLFLDGYLQASEEEKKEIRRSWYLAKKHREAHDIKVAEAPSLFEITKDIEKKNEK